MWQLHRNFGMASLDRRNLISTLNSLKPIHICTLTVCLLVTGCKVQNNADAPFYYSSYEAYKAEIDSTLISCKNFKDSVTAIRGYAHSFYRCGRESSDWETQGYNKAWEWSSREWFTKFNADSISTKCGGAASFLSSLYKAYGFNSFNISIGGRDSLDKRGHVQVAVSNSKNCCPDLHQLFIMDPMFNFHYERGGKLQSLSEMLDLFERGAEDSLMLVTHPSNALHLQSWSFINPFLPEIDASDKSAVFMSRNAVSKYIVSAPRTIDKYLQGSFRTLYSNIIHEHGVDVELSGPSDFKFTVLAIRGLNSTCCRSTLESSYKEKRDKARAHLM